MAPLIFLLTSDALAPLQLKADPVGWDGLRTLLARDTQTHGVKLSMSADLTFVKQGAEYLRVVYEGGTDANGQAVAARGVEGLVTLTVFEQNPNEFTPQEIYRGRLDFISYVSAETGVTCKFKETGFATSLLTRDQTEVDLFGNESLSGVALPAYAPVTATLHSQETLQRFEMAQAAPPVPPLPAGQIFDNDEDTDQLSQLLFFGMDPPALNDLGIEPFAIGPVAGDSFSPENIPFYTAKASGQHIVSLRLNTAVRVEQISGGYYQQVDIKYEFKSIIGGAKTITPLITPYHKDAPFAQRPLLQGGGNDETFTFNTAPFTFTLQMEPGDQLYLYGEVYVHQPSSTPSVSSVTLAMNPGSYLKVSAVTTTAATTCAGLLMHEALARCVEACTDQRDSLYSEYFGRIDTRIPYAQNGPGAFRLVTTGFQLRGFPLPSATAPAPGLPDTRKTISLALRDLYQSDDAIDCLGMGIEQRNGRPVVRIEPRAYFYQGAETLRLGRVAELKKSVYPELLYNAATVGYAHWQSGAANGLDEFNGLRTYALPLTQIKKTYVATSKLNAAGYLIEEARRDRYADGSTKEGKADAEPFVICLVPGTGNYVSEQEQAFVPGSVSGILSPATAYNLRLSPGRMLRAHGPWIRAGLAAQVSQRALLGKVEGNAHLISQRVGEAAPLDEARSVPLTELAPPLVLAETYEFTTRVRRGQMNALVQAPYGLISFLDSNSQRKSGYLLRVERAPQGGLTTFTLLRAA